jgi:hypothetical protein
MNKFLVCPVPQFSQLPKALYYYCLLPDWRGVGEETAVPSDGWAELRAYTSFIPLCANYEKSLKGLIVGYVSENYSVSSGIWIPLWQYTFMRSVHYFDRTNCWQAVEGGL